MIVVLMGVTGSGKTTIGTLLAERTGSTFADADDFHSVANKEKMAAGHPLSDADRQPWLETLNRLLQGWLQSGKSGVLACSALKSAYRATLGVGMPPDAIRFVVLEGSKELISQRLAARKHAYMSPTLLDSQFATLEIPPAALHVVNDRTPDEVVSQILNQLTPAQNPAQK